MVVLAITLGIYSYLILALGLLGWLYKIPVLLMSLPFIIFWLFQLKKVKLNFSGWHKEISKDKLIGVLLIVFGIQFIVNLLGAISPELSFDALWYHLPSVKMYVENHRIFYISGWLLWPSNLTRLTEMFYTVGLLFGNEVWAKLIHFSFGILSAAALFNLLKKYFSLRICLLGIVTFYTMLIVGWQSTTAYVDLSRTFFEILALDLFLQWYQSKKDLFLWESAILLGLALSTKIMAFSSLAGFVILLFFFAKKEKIKKILTYVFLSILIVSPWLILSFIHTGNPLFPLFGNFKNPASPGLPLNGIPWFILNLEQLILVPWKVTIMPDDIISPVYLIFLPLILFTIWKQKAEFKIVSLFIFSSLIFSPLNSNRYLLPYLPALTLVTLSVFDLEYFKKMRWQRLFVGIIIFGALVNLGSRILATGKFIPFLSGKETKAEFLSRNLNFTFGDFYDVDNWFADNIKKEDLVLIYDIHNLYYVNFPYVHESWAKSGTYITHILVGNNQKLPEKFGERILLYRNYKTGVRLYLFGEKLP